MQYNAAFYCFAVILAIFYVISLFGAFFHVS